MSLEGATSLDGMKKGMQAIGINEDSRYERIKINMLDARM